MKHRVTRLRVLIPIDVYRKDVLFLFGYTHEQAAALLSKADMDTEELCSKLLEQPEDYHGITFVAKTGAVVILMPHVPYSVRDYGTIVHELFHATEGIMANVGIPHGEELSEAWAYLLTYLYEAVVKQLAQYE